MKCKVPWVFTGWMRRSEKAVSSNPAAACPFLARLTRSCSKFQPVNRASRSDWTAAWTDEKGVGPRQHTQMRNRAGSLNHWLLLFFPKVIKMEPDVGCQAAVVSQAVGRTPIAEPLGPRSRVLRRTIQ